MQDNENERIEVERSEPRRVNNALVWLLACAPLLGVMIENYLREWSGFHNAKIGFGTALLNLGLSYGDASTLSRRGIGTQSFGRLAWLIPVYLWKRAKVLGQLNLYFWVWCALFLSAFYAPGLLRLEQDFVTQMQTGIKNGLEEKDGRAVADMALTKIDRDHYTGVATYANGESVTVEVTVDGLRYTWKIALIDQMRATIKTRLAEKTGTDVVRVILNTENEGQYKGQAELADGKTVQLEATSEGDTYEWKAIDMPAGKGRRK